ncbi:hypothetical protein C8J98_102718 [Luteibacter sp. OK325]|uniref:hypothetical protein n=1 Tax=Luteibacter sp. OK325 TaxID=2135670 RepID=UPI000D3AF05E|nr:hypothetical protein [Luteibacter sp. OK325]PTR34529.1 hypothetical protein C8J98_102718 [Luteibacter sp. OK325]
MNRFQAIWTNLAGLRGSIVTSGVFLAAAAVTTLVSTLAPEIAAAKTNHIFVRSQEDFDRLHATLGDNDDGKAAQKYCEKMSRHKICIRVFSTEYSRYRPQARSGQTVVP